MKVKVPNIRIGYAPGLFESKAPPQGGTPKFNSSFILDPATAAGKAAIKILEDAMTEVEADKWGKKVPKSVIRCLQDGDKKDHEAYEDKLFFNASNKLRPDIRGPQAQVLVAEDGALKSGDYGTVWIDLWAQDNEFGKRVNATLISVQKLKDGEAIGAEQAKVDESEYDVVDGDDANPLS